MKDDVGIETGKIDSLAHSEDTCEDIEDKDGTSSRLCGVEEEENADDGEEDGTEGGDYEDDGEDMMEGDTPWGVWGGHGAGCICCEREL